MKKDRKTERRGQIEAAAYEVLVERGFSGATMLKIARRARASNETLYGWYGSKTGLFASMIASNRAIAAEALTASLEGERLAADLEAFGSALLQGILSDRAILLNRAAAADASGELARSLAETGRGTILPLLVRRLRDEPLTDEFADHGDMAECFISLLVGDLQIRRLIGVIEAPDAATCAARAGLSVRRFLRLMRPCGTDQGRGD